MNHGCWGFEVFAKVTRSWPIAKSIRNGIPRLVAVLELLPNLKMRCRTTFAEQTRVSMHFARVAIGFQKSFLMRAHINSHNSHSLGRIQIRKAQATHPTSHHNSRVTVRSLRCNNNWCIVLGIRPRQLKLTNYKRIVFNKFVWTSISSTGDPYENRCER